MRAPPLLPACLALSACLLLPACPPDKDTGDVDDTADTDDPGEVDLLTPAELLLSSYDNTIWVVDVSDPAAASLVTWVPLSDPVTYMDWPALNPERTKFFFAQPDGIWTCDAPECPNPTKLTPDMPDAVFGWFDISPVDGTLVMEVWENYGAGENDIYTMNPDGTGMTRILAVQEEYPFLPNGDRMEFWGAGNVAFSPDGTRVAVNTCGHCGAPEQDDPAACFNDFYSVLYTMNLDGSDRVEETWMVGECYYSQLSWGGNGALYYFVYDYDTGATQATRLQDGVEVPLGGDPLADACLTRSSPDPADEALFVNPCNTGDARHHALGGDAIGAGTTIQIPDPNQPDVNLGTFSWFRWQ